MNKKKQTVVMALLIASCASSFAAELDPDTFALVNGEEIKADVIKLIVRRTIRSAQSSLAS